MCTYMRMCKYFSNFIKNIINYLRRDHVDTPIVHVCSVLCRKPSLNPLYSWRIKYNVHVCITISDGATLTFIVLSDDPLTNLFPCKCRHLTVPEWPAKVRAAQAVLVRRFHT